jgi:hypothetical protein
VVLQLSDDTQLITKYFENPDACDLNTWMVIENVLSCQKHISDLFWKNKLGVDVDVCTIIHMMYGAF